MTAPAPLDLTAVLDDLERAHAAATPGPWELDHCQDELRVTAGTARTQWTEHDGFRLGAAPSSWRSTDLIYEHELEGWGEDDDEPDEQQRLADAALIVAAVNHLPTLIAAVRVALALADEWDEQADRFLNSDLRRGAYIAAASGLRSALTAALSPEPVTS